MELPSLLMSFLSTLVVIIAILFDGKFVVDGNKSLLKRIKPAAYILVLFTIILNFSQAYSSDQTLRETKAQAKRKEVKDSTRIAELFELSKMNISKSDSIRLSVVDNAVKAIDEQRQIIEREKENVFIHLKTEIRLNIVRTFVNYDDDWIKSFEGKDYFINAKLENEYILKYSAISKNDNIITHLMVLSEFIESQNSIIDNTLNTSTVDKSLNIKTILKSKRIVYEYLYELLCKAINLNSYTKFETINFGEKFEIIDVHQMQYLYNLKLKSSDIMLIEETINKIRNRKGATN